MGLARGWAFALIVLLSLEKLPISSGQASSQATGSTRSTAQQQLTGSVLENIRDVRQQIYSFWQSFGPDTQWGGFKGTLDLRGAAVPTTDKGLVQQARHVW